MVEMIALARIQPVDALGMVTIRADLDRSGDAIAEAVGLAIPGITRFVTDGSRTLGWMSPDELLLTLPGDDVASVVASLEDALTGEHHLVADVSAMRCAFDVLGDGARQVLAKLSPTDFAALGPDGLRRSRAAQVPSAFWPVDGGFRIVAFRSVAVYLRGILEAAAAPGTWLEPR